MVIASSQLNDTLDATSEDLFNFLSKSHNISLRVRAALARASLTRSKVFSFIYAIRFPSLMSRSSASLIGRLPDNVMCIGLIHQGTAAVGVSPMVFVACSLV